MKKSFKFLTDTYLKSLASKYLFGDSPSIADLLLAAELTQLYAMDYPLSTEYPEIHNWF